MLRASMRLRSLPRRAPFALTLLVTGAALAAPPAPVPASAPASAAPKAAAPASSAPKAAAPVPASAPVSAAPVALDVRAQAAALFEEGAGLFRKRSFREASERFQAAYNLDPSPILLYNLARAAEEMGDPQAAVGHYKAYLLRYPQAEDRDKVETQIRVLGAIASKLPPGEVTLQGVPAGAIIEFDGQPAPAPSADGRFALPPGKHTAVVKPADAEPEEQAFDLASAGSVSLSFGFDSNRGGGGGHPLRLWGWIGTGLGLAAGGVGLYYYLDAGAMKTEGDKDRKKAVSLLVSDPAASAKFTQKFYKAVDRVNSDSTMYPIFAGVGGALLATGVTLLVIDATSGGDAPQTAVIPYPGGVGFTTSF